MRTAETIDINKRLKIVKVENQKFKTIGGYFKPEGYTLLHPELGYFSFKGDVPYMPKGGKQVLQDIMDAGGFLNFDNCVWLKPM